MFASMYVSDVSFQVFAGGLLLTLECMLTILVPYCYCQTP